MLVQISTADGIAKNAGPYVFQSIIQNSATQDREGLLLLEKFTFKTAAILVENNDFGLSFRANIRKRLEQAGVRIVLDIPQDRQDANWYSTITRIKGAAPDLVVLWSRPVRRPTSSGCREQRQDPVVLGLHTAALHFREPGRTAGRTGGAGAGRLFLEQPRRDAASEGVRG
jgi:hypothetical protein